MRARPLAVVAVLLVCAGCASSAARRPAAAPSVTAAAATASVQEDDGDGGAARGVLLYLPNRVFDLLDVVRARLRVGPGVAVSLRATEVADLYLGGYTTIWGGLPGPREEAGVNWPWGLEGRAGLELGPADLAAEAVDPDYGAFEIGLGVQALVVGGDVGVELDELLDFLAGLLTFDPSDDDL